MNQWPETSAISSIPFGLTCSLDTPKQVTAASNSAIDNKITNIKNNLTKLLKTTTSDHDAQEIVIKECLLKSVPPIVTLRRTVHSEYVLSLNKQLQRQNWTFLDSFDGCW